MNKIICDDYKNVIKNYEYDYIFTSPPDFSELGIKPSELNKYADFLLKVFSLANPKKNLITVAFTDRKANGGVISKSSSLNLIMDKLGYQVKSHKIWVKTTKIDLYRLTYANVITFGKGKTKNNQHKEFKTDVWMDGREKYKNYNLGMPTNVPIRCILNYTDIGDVVYDPFMGSGTTAVACLDTDRNYLGSEINKDYYNLSLDRIKNRTVPLF